MSYISVRTSARANINQNISIMGNDMSETVAVEKNSTDNEPEVLTQVTSLAQEELKAGKQMDLPAPEVIANNAMAAYIKATQELAQKLKDNGISKISIAKAVLAGLDLPEENLPVNLKTKAEKEIFNLVQIAVNTRFLLTQYHIDLRRRELQAAKTTNNNEGVENV